MPAKQIDRDSFLLWLYASVGLSGLCFDCFATHSLTLTAHPVRDVAALLALHLQIRSWHVAVGKRVSQVTPLFLSNSILNALIIRAFYFILFFNAMFLFSFIRKIIIFDLYYWDWVYRYKIINLFFCFFFLPHWQWESGWGWNVIYFVN